MKLNHYLMEDALESLIDYRGKTPKKSDEGIPTLSAKSVKNGYIDYGECYYISPEEYKKFMVRGFPKVGDVLLTTEAPMGMVAKLDRDDVAIAQRLITLRGKEGVLDNDYLLYYLQSPIGQHKLAERETGSTVTGIKQAAFRKIEIDIPDIEIQRKIAACLSCIDAKISTNKLINRNLLEQAQTLFSKYYDTAEEVEEFRILIDVLGGGTPKTSNDDYWNGSIPFFTPKDVGMPYTFQTEKSITEEGLQHCNSKVYPTNTTFVTARGTVGKVSLAGVPMAMNQSCYALASEKLPEILVYFYTLEAVKSLRHKASGAVFDAIVTRDFDTEKIRVLDYITTESFMKFASPTFEQIHMNTVENLQLHDLRDGMLPKLMSGELDISDVKI